MTMSLHREPIGRYAHPHGRYGVVGFNQRWSHDHLVWF